MGPIIGGVVAVVVVLLLIWVIATYNRLVRLRNKTQDAWAGIDVQLQRRADLVPNLVETVQGYSIHEQHVLESVAQARSQMIAAAGPRQAGQADDALERSLNSLFAVAEAYPDLKASANFLALQTELATLEEDISFARRYYNAVVEQFDTAQQTLPTVVIARPMGFQPAEFFKADADDREAPSARMTA